MCLLRLGVTAVVGPASSAAIGADAGLAARTRSTAVGDDQDVTSADTSVVTVAARLTATMHRAVRKSGRTNIYRAGRTASMKTGVSPILRTTASSSSYGPPVHGRWGHSIRSDCVELTSASPRRPRFVRQQALAALP